MNEISRINVTVGGDHGQGAFRFPMKLLFIMKSSKKFERKSSVIYILYKRDYDDILKNTIIETFQESFMLMLDPIKINNHQTSIDKLYVTSDFEFLIILLGKEF